MAILLTLLALALLALIIYLLHTYQQQQKIDSVDRTVPLPPLDANINLVGNAIPEDILNLELTDESVPSTAGEAQDEAAVPAPQHETLPPSADWLAQSRTLKEQGNFDQALETARTAYPQLGAFRQACVILRARLREERRMERDQEATLRELYDTCALAAFVHGADDELPPLPVSGLRRLHDRSWQQLPMPYDRLGTLHLDLLTATDVKMLTTAWGKPSHHERVRHFHKDTWLRLQKALSAGH